MLLLKPYLTIARFDNWSKNLAMFVGVALGMLFTQKPPTLDVIILIEAMAALCFASSANYIINEYIDAKFDRFHPVKRKRAGVKHKLDGRMVALEYIVFSLVALSLAFLANRAIAETILVYLIGAWFYNIPPIRIKDIPYADVILESVNYPLRILIGWFCVVSLMFPPSSALLIAWTVGAFMMSIKRLAERQLFKTVAQASAYRKSYRYYTSERLILASFAYALFSMFGIAVFLIKYRIEFIMALPLIALWFVWYLKLGLVHAQNVIYPEKLFKQYGFLSLSIGILILLIVLAKVDIPQMHLLYQPMFF